MGRLHREERLRARAAIITEMMAALALCGVRRGSTEEKRWVEIAATMIGALDRARAADYRKMGVETVWIIDPKTRTGRYCVDDVWTAAKRLVVPDTPIFVDLDWLFSRLDRKRPQKHPL